MVLQQNEFIVIFFIIVKQNKNFRPIVLLFSCLSDARSSSSRHNLEKINIQRSKDCLFSSFACLFEATWRKPLKKTLSNRNWTLESSTWFVQENQPGLKRRLAACIVPHILLSWIDTTPVDLHAVSMALNVTFKRMKSLT